MTRVLLSHVANLLVSLVFGVSLKDHGCTLKAYRREFLQELRLYGEMHRFIPVYTAAAVPGSLKLSFPIPSAGMGNRSTAWAALSRSCST